MLRSVNLYLSAEKAIVAACHHNSAGVRYEQEDPIIVVNWQDDDSLTGALRSALDRFSFKERDLRDAKKTDWPAYKVSGLRAVSDFERAYLRLFVNARDESGVMCAVSVEPAGEKNIRLESTLFFGGRLSDVSRDIGRLYEVCSKWDLMLF